MISAPVWVFALFGITTQAILVGYFAARRWAPRIALPIGVVAYTSAALGLPISVWLLAEGQSPRLWAGPLLLAVWGGFGAIVDLWRRVEWRDSLQPSVLAPYVALYVLAQMFLWWPLWDYARLFWVVFGLLFIANTVMNIAGHFPGRRTVAT